MTQPDYLFHAERDGSALLDIARVHPDVRIAACPEWDMRSLVGHLGSVFAMINAQVAAATTEPTSPGEAATPPEGGDIFDWAEERLGIVLETMAATPPETTCWSWTDDHSAGFFRRRLANEISIHLWDAQHAAGVAAGVDPEMAADGIDEYLGCGLKFSSSKPDRSYPDGSLHLHRTDGEGEWMLSTDDAGELVITHEHGKGDAAVRGSAEGLLLFLWKRGDNSDLEIFGDESVAIAWADLAP